MINEIYPIIGIIPCNLSDTVELKVVKKPQKKGLTMVSPIFIHFTTALLFLYHLLGMKRTTWYDFLFLFLSYRS